MTRLNIFYESSPLLWWFWHAHARVFGNRAKADGAHWIPVSYTHLDVYKRQAGMSFMASEPRVWEKRA